MSHLMSYGNISDPQAQISAPPFHQQLYRHMTSVSSDNPTNCSEMLTHELSEPQQPNLILKDACSQDLPGDEAFRSCSTAAAATKAIIPLSNGECQSWCLVMSTVGSADTSGSLGIPDPLAVHARPPVQHYELNANAIPFENARAPVQHYDFSANAIPFERARAPMLHLLSLSH